MEPSEEPEMFAKGFNPKPVGRTESFYGPLWGLRSMYVCMYVCMYAGTLR